MDFLKRAVKWFRNQRSSTRLSFLLQICCRILLSLFAFIWTPLLLGSMGKSLNGLFLNFQKMASLGGLGDLGMGGVVNIRTSRLLGQGRENELRSFLNAARGVFFIMAVLAGVIFLVVSPLLFKALKFDLDPQAGFLPMLSIVGGVAVGFVVLNSFINNLNYGCANIAWPIVPSFFITQMAILGHWLLARHHAVLWTQYIPYVLAAVLLHGLGWVYLRTSHASLATIWPVTFGWRQFGDLFGSSFWIYLNLVATGIWITTDMFLITARFGSQMIPAYQYNYKLCELALFVVNSAGIASLPKITQWVVSSEATARERGIHELTRLNKFQTFLGCCAGLVYLSVNNSFMGFWLGNDYQVPILWQIAFAASVAVTGAGQMGGDLASRCCEKGIRVAGIASLAAALLNFGLSLLAIKLSPVLGMTTSIFGIALATVIAASALYLYFGWFSARQLRISWWQLTVKHWLLALGTVLFSVFIRLSVPQIGATNIALYIILHLIAFLIIARVVGIGLNDLRHEQRIFQAMFIKKKDSQK
jgi:O-antigen/teichoic acid export membrane protein